MYYGIENQTHCSYSSLYLSIFLSFNAKFVSQFSQELCELESSNTVQNERLYRGIETQGHGSYSFIFYPFFISFPILHVSIQNMCQFSQKLL